MTYYRGTTTVLQKYFEGTTDVLPEVPHKYCRCTTDVLQKHCRGAPKVVQKGHRGAAEVLQTTRPKYCRDTKPGSTTEVHTSQVRGHKTHDPGQKKPTIHKVSEPRTKLLGSTTEVAL